MTDNNPEIMKRYRILRNRITNKLKYEKTQFYKEKFNKENLSTKEMWNQIQTIFSPYKIKNSFLALSSE